MRISIVMAYNNRLSQLNNTLDSIRRSKHAESAEVIIVDDASDSGQEARNITPIALDIKILELTKVQKTWVNPCIVYNKGFKLASNDIIVIQNPECFHCGDVLDHILNNLTEENYLSYSCWNMRKPMLDQNIAPKSTHGNWYNHPTKGRQTAYHFLSAITKKNLDRLNGFDERYGPGYCFDDDEILARIRRMGLKVQIVPDTYVYCAHQYHEKTIVGGEPWQRNRRLFEDVTSNETGYRANE